MSNILKKTLLLALFASPLYSHAGVFGTYDDEGTLFRNSLNSEIPSPVLAKIEDKDKDAVLYLLEKARLLQAKSSISRKF